MRAKALSYLNYLGSRGIKNIKSKSLKVTDESSVQPSVRSDTEIKKVSSLKNVFDTNTLFEGAEGLNCLDDVRANIGDCKKCGLCEYRTNIVFGEGNPKAKLMFIGEGPGREEDESGRPFVGRAGQLLTKIIEAMGLKREDVYIANIVKCRPPANRTPLEDEIINCAPYLMQQIKVIKPKVIVTLGSPASCTLLNEKIKISSIRGTFYEWNDGIKLMPTFHPAYLLRNPNDKKLVWEDVQKVMPLIKD
jgi:DNA polymerase